jgi:hypothetical protein
LLIEITLAELKTAAPHSSSLKNLISSNRHLI